jgi:hypothetical protein
LWFNVHIDLDLGFLHRVDVGSVADVSEVHAASIFRAEVGKVSKILYIFFPANHRKEGGLVPLYRPYWPERGTSLRFSSSSYFEIKTYITGNSPYPIRP